MNFLIELSSRFISNTPSFFKVVRTISIVIAIITGLPELLTESGIVLPEAWEAVSSKIISIGAVISGLIAQLTATTEDKVAKGIKD